MHSNVITVNVTLYDTNIYQGATIESEIKTVSKAELFYEFSLFKT